MHVGIPTDGCATVDTGPPSEATIPRQTPSTQPTQSPETARLRPSGDQSKKSTRNRPLANSSIRRVPDPSAATRYHPGCRETLAQTAIHRPSGDHCAHSSGRIQTRRLALATDPHSGGSAISRSAEASSPAMRSPIPEFDRLDGVPRNIGRACRDRDLGAVRRPRHRGTAAGVQGDGPNQGAVSGHEVDTRRQECAADVADGGDVAHVGRPGRREVAKLGIAGVAARDQALSAPIDLGDEEVAIADEDDPPGASRVPGRRAMDGNRLRRRAQ